MGNMLNYKIPGVPMGRMLLHLHCINGCVQQFYSICRYCKIAVVLREAPVSLKPLIAPALISATDKWDITLETFCCWQKLVPMQKNYSPSTPPAPSLQSTTWEMPKQQKWTGKKVAWQWTKQEQETSDACQNALIEHAQLYIPRQGNTFEFVSWGDFMMLISPNHLLGWC